MKPLKGDDDEYRVRQVANLTAPERETVINGSDADDTITIWTAQRRIITKLKRNSAATLVDEGFYGSTAWAQFSMPASMLSFRSTRQKRTLTDEQRAEMGDRLRKARQSS